MDPHRRYLIIKSLVEELENGKPTRTYGWFNQQYEYLKDYREYFGDFDSVRNSNPLYNEKAMCLNPLLTSLERDFINYGWFSLHDYLQFNKTLVWLVDCEDDDSLDDLFYKMNLSWESN